MRFQGYCLFLFAAITVAAQPGQADTPAGNAFVSACAGVGVYSSVTPGRAWNDDVSSGGTTCNFATGASVSESVTANGGTSPSYSESATGMAAEGALHMAATNAGDSSFDFPDGVVNAGWNANVTVNATTPGYNGMQGFWVFSLHFSGSLTTAGNDPDAQAWVEIFQNRQSVTPDTNAQATAPYNYFLANNTTHNGPIYSGWDDEEIGYLANSSAPSLPIDAILIFAVPVTVGQQFELGIWAGISAGEGSAGGSLGPDTANADFSDTLTWNGSSYLVIDGQNVGFSVTSQSGFNYNLSTAEQPNCNVNSQAGVDVSDVQQMINEAIGTASPGNDQNGDGVVSVADIQIVVNAALGGNCS